MRMRLSCTTHPSQLRVNCCCEQTQLVLHMSQMGDKYFYNGPRLHKPDKHPVDIRKWASANNGMLDRFALWNVDPSRRPLTEGKSATPHHMQHITPGLPPPRGRLCWMLAVALCSARRLMLP